MRDLNLRYVDETYDEPILRNFQRLIDKAITGACRGARERRAERDRG